jgi:hypothetical protein
MASAPRSNSGRALNDKWSIGAAHALYHVDGTWYHVLERFPAALCDPHGYVLFDTEHAYRHCPYLRIGIRTRVLGGISQMPGYVRVQ